MGPREKNLREGGCAHEYCSDLKIARLADALEEALAFWDDAGVAEANAVHHERLRAVLAEVDRG